MERAGVIVCAFTVSVRYLFMVKQNDLPFSI